MPPAAHRTPFAPWVRVFDVRDDRDDRRGARWHVVPVGVGVFSAAEDIDGRPKHRHAFQEEVHRRVEPLNGSGPSRSRCSDQSSRDNSSGAIALGVAGFCILFVLIVADLAYAATLALFFNRARFDEFYFFFEQDQFPGPGKVILDASRMRWAWAAYS